MKIGVDCLRPDHAHLTEDDAWACLGEAFRLFKRARAGVGPFVAVTEEMVAQVLAYRRRNLEEMRAEEAESGKLSESPPEELLRQAFASLYGKSQAREFIFQQHRIQTEAATVYRLDFAIPSRRVAIEVDGQEFHSSQESRQADYRRDRALLGAGWITLRFTATEVVRDARACALEVSRLLALLNPDIEAKG